MCCWAVSVYGEYVPLTDSAGRSKPGAGDKILVDGKCLQINSDGTTTFLFYVARSSAENVGMPSFGATNSIVVRPTRVVRRF